MVDKFFAPKDFEQNIDELNQKHAILDKKRDLEKQIFALRMKHNAMLKSEFETKMKQLQDKWAEVENLTVEDEIPGREDIEQMVGLTGKQHVRKSLAEMMRPRSKAVTSAEEANAKRFIKSIKIQKQDRQKLLDDLQKRRADQEKAQKEENDRRQKELEEE